MTADISRRKCDGQFVVGGVSACPVNRRARAKAGLLFFTF